MEPKYAAGMGNFAHPQKLGFILSSDTNTSNYFGLIFSVLWGYCIDFL